MCNVWWHFGADIDLYILSEIVVLGNKQQKCVHSGEKKFSDV